jgi:ABC-2 type transport system permease protein
VTSWSTTLGWSFVRASRQARRNPVLAFGFPMVASVAMVAVFAQLVSRIGDVQGFPAPSYVDWVVAGAVTMVPMTSAIFSGAALATDISSGYLDRVRLLPVNPIAFLTGRVLFDGVRVLPATVIVLLVSNA